MENDYRGEVSNLVETLEFPAIHAMAASPDQQAGKELLVAVDAQIQDVVQNFGHHVQASLESVEFDLVGLGNNTTRAHVLDGEYYE